jgi:hypothetical protein
VKWCALTHEGVIGPVFFDEDIITSNSFLDMLENYALSHVSSTNNLILQLDGAPLHLADIVRDYLKMNFASRWKGGGPIAWPYCSPDLMPLDFFLLG